MRFRQAVERTDGLDGAYRAGLGALRPTDRRHVRASDPGTLTGSMDLDTALKPSHPNAPRWDYGVAQAKNGRRRERVYWIEVHPATSDASMKEVERKFEWLLRWLAGRGRRLQVFEKDFIWISSGATRLNSRSPAAKRLAQRGLQAVGGHSRIR